MSDCCCDPFSGGGGGGTITQILGADGITITAPLGPNVTVNGTDLYPIDASRPADNFVTIGTVFTSIVPATVTNLYVDDVTGNDANSGLVGFPTKTIGAALLKIGDLGVLNTTNIFISPFAAAGTYAGFDEQLKRLQDKRADLSFVGVGDTEVFAALALTAAPNVFDLTFGAPGWTVGAWNGLHLECVTAVNAANVGVKRLVGRNDASTISLPYAFPAAVTVGDTFRLVRPAVNLSVLSCLSSLQFAVNFVNVQFNLTTSTPLIFESGTYRFWGVIANTASPTSANVRFERSKVSFALSASSSAYTAIGVSLSNSIGWGLSVVRSAGLTVGGLRFQNYSECLGASLVCSNLRVDLFSRFTAWGCAFHTSNISASFFLESAVYAATYSWLLLGGSASFQNIFENLLEVDASTRLIHLEKNAYALISGARSIVQMSGTRGIELNSRGSALFNGGSVIVAGPLDCKDNGSSVQFISTVAAGIAGGFTVGNASLESLTQASFPTVSGISAGGASIERVS